MKNLDYYTVMESRIKYFSRKYDPQNKLGGENTIVIKKDSSPEPVKRPTTGKKILKKLDSVIAMFL